MIHGPPAPTLFPYTTLFRSEAGERAPDEERDEAHRGAAERRDDAPEDERDEEDRLAREAVGDEPRERRRAGVDDVKPGRRSEEHTSELQSHSDLVCRLLLEK